MTKTSLQMAPEKKLRASNCDRCGGTSFPAQMVCPKCGPTHMNQVRQIDLPSTGIVRMWTRLRVTPSGFPSPLTLCVVEVGGVKLLGSVEANSEIQDDCLIRITDDPAGIFPYQFSRQDSTTRTG